MATVLFSIVEDLHWIDPSFFEFLGLLVDQAPTILLFVLPSPTGHHLGAMWNTWAHVAQLTLNRLSRQQVEQMVTSIAGSRTSSDGTVCGDQNGRGAFCLWKSSRKRLWPPAGQGREGHYELTGFLPAPAIPTTLHDSLMARIDRLVTAKGVAQLAATLGRRFLIRCCAGGVATRRGNIAARTWAAGRVGAALSARSAAICHIHVQACTHSRGGLSVAPEEHAAALSSV